MKKKIELVEFIYDYIGSTLSDGTKIKLEMGEILNASGNISITGKEIKVTNTALFCDLLRLADVFDFYNRLDDTVVFDMSFNNLTVEGDDLSNEDFEHDIKYS